MKKVFVTGAGGFIGSHLCEALVEKGYEVKAFVRYNSRNFWGWLETSQYKKEMEIISGNIRDYDSVRNAMEDTDMVFHLAALIGIPYSYISPLAYVKTNIEGTYNVLQAAKIKGVEKIIHTSTSEVYGTAQFVPITEKHPINPQSPYAATKASADFLAISYYRSFNTPVTVIRPFNTYGPRQSARAIIPTIIIQALNNEGRVRLGSLHPTRDMLYVKDIVEGFMKIAHSKQSIGEVINFGLNREITINKLVKLIAELMNVKITIEKDTKRERPSKSEVERLFAETKKAKELMGWLPKWTLEDGLEETIKWFSNSKNLAIYKSNIYNI
jgi:NAD dependent epimerase/dehydratase